MDQIASMGILGEVYGSKVKLVYEYRIQYLPNLIIDIDTPVQESIIHAFVNKIQSQL